MSTSPATSTPFAVPPGYRVSSPFVLGLDLDEVSARYPKAIAPFVAKHLGLPDGHVFPDLTHYSFVQSNWGIKDEAEYRAIHGAAVEQGLYTLLEEMEGASAALWALQDAGVEISVITSRFVNPRQHARVIADTGVWLDKFNIPYKSICFIADKVRVLADVYVDDSPTNIKNLRAAGREVVVYDTGYNRDFDGRRAYNWSDVMRHVYEVETARTA